MIRRSMILIDQLHLDHNINMVKQLAPGSKIIAMVKANAYGCGYESVLPVFHEQVNALGVACINEAIVIRQLGYNTPCILFQGICSYDEFAIIDEYGFELVIHSKEQLERFLSYSFQNRIRCWLKIDTGMHRLGFSIDELPSALKQLTECSQVERPIGIMSHLACADKPDHELNGIQVAEFDSIRTMLGENFVYSLANSAAVMAQPNTLYDTVRPGIMLYGCSPLANKTAVDLGLKPVNYFSSQILAIKTIPAGETVGYGAIWKAKKKTNIAIVGVGYGDGYPRHINEQAYVAVNDQPASIIGRLSMDMLVIDISQLSNISVGDSVELWGDTIPIDLVANWAGTISYELLCQLKSRVEPK